MARQLKTQNKKKLIFKTDNDEYKNLEFCDGTTLRLILTGETVTLTLHSVCSISRLYDRVRFPSGLPWLWRWAALSGRRSPPPRQTGEGWDTASRKPLLDNGIKPSRLKKQSVKTRKPTKKVKRVLCDYFVVDFSAFQLLRIWIDINN